MTTFSEQKDWPVSLLRVHLVFYCEQNSDSKLRISRILDDSVWVSTRTVSGLCRSDQLIFLKELCTSFMISTSVVKRISSGI
jgi:hypothetical protein